ncbi:MAG: hypothetical protein Q9211_002591, partial [Gyalolechia sp. 1 TL-2023]
MPAPPSSAPQGSSTHPQPEQQQHDSTPFGTRLNTLAGGHNPRKPTPSPLQLSHSLPLRNGPTFFTEPEAATHDPASSSPSSPHSPRSPTQAIQDRPMSPQDRLDELLATEPSRRDGSMISRPGIGSRMDPASAPPKTGSYHQLRNISAPIPLSKSLGSSPPASPVRTASTSFPSSTIRPTLSSMPRTSSIDSAISTISSATSHSHKSSQDSSTSTGTDITHLINTAGSAEALIQHLLRDSQNSAAQNAQLWKLVDKQRTLLLGLNQDLERALKEKDRYRKKLKEYIAQAPPLPRTTAQPTSTHTRAGSESPVGHASCEETPVQRNKDRDTAILDPRTVSQGAIDGSTHTTNPVNTMGGVVASSTQQAPVSANTYTPDAVAQTLLISKPPSDGNNPERSLAPIQTANLDRPRKLKADASRSASVSPSIDAVVSPNSFTRKRSLPFAQKAPPNPSFQLTESTPVIGANEWQPLPRKLPPAPLDLRPTPKEPQYGPEDHSGSEYEDGVEVDELPAFERGRKKTREDDDREREVALLRDQEDRSRSRKSTKGSKPPAKAVPAAAAQLYVPPAVRSLPPDQPVEGESSGYLATPASLAGVLSPPNKQSIGTKSKTLSALPISPGLPVSPRPIDRPLISPAPRMPRDGTGAYGTSPPLSPRNGLAGLPLSPRAPGQPIPLPPHTPMSLVSPILPSVEAPKERAPEPYDPKDHQPEYRIADNPLSKQAAANQVEVPKSRGIFRGFVSDSYPDLLIPPNALPSISVRVNSSRLKPSSRLSYLGHRVSEDEPVFTLGISARSDMRELWQVEKPLASLPSLDHEIKRTTAFDVKLPDRALFNGHAPAKIDARRVALERYFEMVLDTSMDEKAAVALCRYLSTQAIEPAGDDNASIMNISPGSPVQKGPDRRLVKEGYLTKRGKNFGGWKARFFALDEPILRYYESPGGTLLGTIKLHNAQIGKQSSHQSSSPSRYADDGDSQYRHAFLILEPKRKDSNSYVRHVLCAESDAERDIWVEALLFYVEEHSNNDRAKQPIVPVLGSNSGKVLRKQIARKDGAYPDSPESATFDGLQALSYDNTLPAQPPVVSIVPERANAETPSPPLSDNTSAGRASQASKPISGPSNGARIEDAGAWGNKTPQAKDLKEPKKRGIWGFRDKNPDLSAHADETRMSIFEPPPVEMNPNARPTFGVPLAEAVEFCSPKGVDVSLPAVVYRCLEYLEAQDAAREEGIFRLSGSSVVIKALRDRFNNQGDFDFLADGQYYDVHAVASLLKLYLRELPSTVLTRELHLDFLSVLELDSRPRKIAAYNILVHRLPKANWTLIRALSAFLINIVNSSDVNKMSVRNVGIVFSPTLNIPAPVFSMFLTEFDAIFGDGLEQASAPSSEGAVNEPSTPEDIRSPMLSDIPPPSSNPSNFPQARPNPTGNDTGFVSLRPSYEGQVVPGPEPSSGSRSLAPDGAVKARRRESSMLLVGGNQRKSFMPLLREDS